jgi:hypothetical protein
MALHVGTGKGPGHLNRVPAGLGGGGGGAGTAVQQVLYTSGGAQVVQATRTQQAVLGGTVVNEKTL